MNRHRIKRKEKKTVHSESHKLEIEFHDLKAELYEVNKDYKEHEDKEGLIQKYHRKIPVAVLGIWLVMILLITSLFLTAAGTYSLGKGMVEKTATEYSEKIMIINDTGNNRYNTARPWVPDTDERYYGVMLESFVPVAYKYETGEQAILESGITLNDNDSIEMFVEYEMYNPDKEKVYTYGDKIRVTNNSMLRKAVLLTDNYKEGMYLVKFRASFENGKRKYVLPGATMFMVEKRQEPGFVAMLGKDVTNMDGLQKILLVLILILNLLLLYNSWKMEDN